MVCAVPLPPSPISLSLSLSLSLSFSLPLSLSPLSLPLFSVLQSTPASHAIEYAAYPDAVMSSVWYCHMVRGMLSCLPYITDPVPEFGGLCCVHYCPGFRSALYLSPNSQDLVICVIIPSRRLTQNAIETLARTKLLVIFPVLVSKA